MGKEFDVTARLLVEPSAGETITEEAVHDFIKEALDSDEMSPSPTISIRKLTVKPVTRERRPILVSFIYNDAGNPEGCHSFMERVMATRDEERRIRDRLQKLTDLTVDPQVQTNAPIYDLYVGPDRDKAATFEAFWKGLDDNPYIATHEEEEIHEP